MPITPEQSLPIRRSRRIRAIVLSSKSTIAWSFLGYLKTRPPSCYPALMLILLVATTSLGGPQPSDATFSELLLKRVSKSVGLDYRQARDAFLLCGPDIEPSLRRRMESVDANDEDRWLAGILRARAADPAGFTRLEAEFARLVHRAHRLGPFLGNIEGERYVGHLSPPGLDLPPRSWGLGMGTLSQSTPIPSLARWEAERRQFSGSLKLPPSPDWGAFLGEMVLKGWTASPFIPPPTGPGRNAMGMSGPTGLPPKPEVAGPDDHLLQAIHLLAEMGERKAVRPIGRILVDPGRPTSVRLEAAESLGRLGEGLEWLLDAVEDPAADEAILMEVFRTLCHLNDPAAIPRLERIANTPAPPIGSRRVVPNHHEICVSEATRTLVELRRQVLPEPK